MKKIIFSFVLVSWFMVAFSSLAFGQPRLAEDLKRLNAELGEYFRRGNSQKALALAEKIQSITEERYGRNHLETANAFNNVALIYIAVGRYDEAENLSKKALKIYEGLPVKDDACAAIVYDHLEEIFQKTGRFAEMKQARNTAAAIRRNALGEKVVCGALEPLEVLAAKREKSAGRPAPPPFPPPPSPPASPPDRRPASSPEPEAGAFWNGWFEDRNTKARVEDLRIDPTYSFVLDISRYPYFEDSSAEVDPTLGKLIHDARQQGKTTVRFIIRPILHGDLLRFMDHQRAWEELKVDVNKLIEADKLKRDDFLSGKIRLQDFADAVQAGVVRFDLLAERAGDAKITITIWDEKGMIPLDHLTVSVRVMDEGAVTKQESVSTTFPIRAGRQSLLNISSDFSSKGCLIADAAFYVFEKSPRGKSVVLLAAKSGGATTGAPDEVSVYAWETESLLSEYIEGQNQFIAKIRDARRRAISPSVDEWKYSYESAADGLRKKIFGGLRDKDRKQAADAERVFRDLVLRKDRQSLVFARMRNDVGKPIYLPLGILAAGSKNRFLDKRIILVQPLPREHYPAGVLSVKSWTFNVPEKLTELSRISNDALSRLGKNPPYHRDISTVKGFFEVTEPAAASTGPEGVLLLAHQAGGNLWFTDQANGIIREEINRQFAAGSVAILSACSTASSEGNNQAILEKLNANGIDAMIISPFPVHADYGAMLAINFVQAIEQAKKNSAGLSLAELFSRVTMETADYFRNVRNMHFDDMDLEFLIAGDYRIKVGQNSGDHVKGESE